MSQSGRLSGPRYKYIGLLYRCLGPVYLLCSCCSHVPRTYLHTPLYCVLYPSLYMCMYIDTHTCTLTYIHMCIGSHTHYVHTCPHTLAHSEPHTHVHMCVVHVLKTQASELLLLLMGNVWFHVSVSPLNYL